MNSKTREMLAEHYAEITEAAEHQIRELIRRETSEARAVALGVWQLWYAITAGHQADGDTERLEALFRNGSPFDHQPSEN